MFHLQVGQEAVEESGGRGHGDDLVLRNWVMRYMPPRLLAWYFARSIRSEVLAASGGLDLQAGRSKVSGSVSRQPRD
ncbi:MAG: hypothetical protein ACFCUT_16260 [Kiloniellaceae bacterium]